MPKRSETTSVQRKTEPVQYRWIWFVYVLLFALSIPWYFPQSQNPAAIILGLPAWVLASMGAVTCIAIFTAFVIHRFWKDEPDVY